MNKTIRVVVIDNNKEEADLLVKQLNENEKINVVDIFDDGKVAYDYLLLNHNNVDLIVTEMLIPSLDGFSLIDKLIKNKIKKNIIITSSYKEELLIKDLAKYNVIGYFVKPFSIEAIERKISSLYDNEYTFSNNIDFKISELLHNLGIPSHIRGYKYIRDGINMMYNNEAISLITKEIYPQIAYKYETTPSRVERAIRHAIEVSWVRGDINLMEDIFGFSISCEKSKPTNSEFLSTIADRLKILNCVNV